MGTIVSFRVGQGDVDALSKYFQPLFDAEDLLRVPNYNAIVRTLISGVPTQPFSMATMPPLGNPNQQLADALKQLSAAKYGRPRATVESEIFSRIRTEEAPKPAFGAPARPGVPGPFGAAPGMPASGAAPGAFGAAPAPKRPGTGNFLDEWMQKRQQPLKPLPANPFARPGAAPGAPPAEPQVAPLPAAPTAPRPAAPASPHIDIQGPHNLTVVDPSKNISSGELEEKDAQTIAKQIRSNLGADKPAPASAPASNDTLNENDTIFIDPDGNFRQRPADGTSAS
jgi:hypothetical protein